MHGGLVACVAFNSSIDRALKNGEIDIDHHSYLCASFYCGVNVSQLEYLTNRNDDYSRNYIAMHYNEKTGNFDKQTSK